jgi:transcriptional regulator with XRE-family HTH domain
MGSSSAVSPIADAEVPPAAAVLRLLVRIRRELNLSQEEVGRRLGVGQPAVSMLEKHRDPRLSDIARLAAALDVPLTVSVEFDGHTFSYTPTT